MQYNNDELRRFVIKMAKHYFTGLVPKIGTVRWSNRMTTCFGSVDYKKKELAFSIPICRLNNFDYESPEFREVVVHELCHLYLRHKHRKCMGHGKEFQKEMLRCFPDGSVQGGKTFTYHYHKTKRKQFVGEWIYDCGCHPNARARRGPAWIKQGETDIDTRYRCGKCGSYVKFHRYIKK